MLTGFFPLLAWAIYEFSFVNVLITTTTFAAEVFPENPGAAMVPVVGGKNIIAFGAAYGLIPMLHIYSYLKAFMIVSVSRRDPYFFHEVRCADHDVFSCSASRHLYRNLCARDSSLLP